MANSSRKQKHNRNYKHHHKHARVDVVDFDVSIDEVVDPSIITRESVTICPFGEGLVCTRPGCMVCDEGPRCCNPGDTCYLSEQDTTNWCTAFRGTGGGGGIGVSMAVHTAGMPLFAPDPPSFWER